MSKHISESSQTAKTGRKRLFRALSVAALGMAFAAPVSPTAAQEAGASLTITNLAPTRRLDGSTVLGFGGRELVDSASYLRNTIVPGGRATLLFSDTQGENFTPNCLAKSDPYPTTLCGAKVVITYNFAAGSDSSKSFTAHREAELISVNALEKNRIDLIVPNPDTFTDVPAGFIFKGAVVSLELNGKRSDPNSQAELLSGVSAPDVGPIPTIFVDHWGHPKITRPDGSQVTPFNPTKPGERVTVWGTGFGTTQPKGSLTADLNDWSALIDGTPVRITKAEKNAPGVETVQFVVPRAAKNCDGGACLLFLTQEIPSDVESSTANASATLFVNTPTPEIDSLNHTVYGIDFFTDSESWWGGVSDSKLLTPGSFITAELTSALCTGYLQGELAQSFPKPTELCGVKFLFRADGSSQAFEAPLYSLWSKTAIFQVPMEMSGAQSGTVSVSVNGREVSAFPVNFAEMEFIAQGMLNKDEVSATHPDSVIRPGDELDLFGFGLGQTTPATATNTPGGDENQFPSLTMTISGGDLEQPLPIEVLSAAKKARVVGSPDSYEWYTFQSLNTPFGWGYFGPILRDWVRFKVPSTLNSGEYSFELCQNGTCSITPLFRVEKEQTFGQLCVLVKRSNRFGSNANLSGVVVSDAYGLGSGVTDSSGQMCFDSAPTGTKYLVSAKKAGFTFLNRKLSGTIAEGAQVSELTAYAKDNATKKNKKQEKSKKKASGKKKAVKK